MCIVLFPVFLSLEGCSIALVALVVFSLRGRVALFALLVFVGEDCSIMLWGRVSFLDNRALLLVGAFCFCCGRLL